MANLVGLAVSKCLEAPTDRVDLLSTLRGSRPSEGKLMGRMELTTEALSLLGAGSDNTAKILFAVY